MSSYAKCFDNAVVAIDEREHFPGQIIPGVWNINTKGLVPAVIIGVIIADALSSAAKVCDVPFDFILARYERLMQHVPIEVKGSPDQIARTQILKAAIAERANAQRDGLVAQISLEEAVIDAMKYLVSLPEAKVFTDALRTALDASRRSHD